MLIQRSRSGFKFVSNLTTFITQVNEGSLLQLFSLVEIAAEPATNYITQVFKVIENTWGGHGWNNFEEKTT